MNSTTVLKVDIDVPAVAAAVARALLAPTGVAPFISSVTTRDLLGRQLTAEEVRDSPRQSQHCSAASEASPLAFQSARVSTFWDENIAAILALFRAELDELERGRYKYPYDLQPIRALRSGGPGSEQWDPSNVVAMARRYMADQALVAARRKSPAEGAREVAAGLSAEERAMYPDYYL